MEEPNSKIRFLRFDIAAYYPSGGVNSEDLTGKFETLERAKLPPIVQDTAEIYDTWTGQSWFYNKLRDIEWKIQTLGKN